MQVTDLIKNMSIQVEPDGVKISTVAKTNSTIKINIQ